MEAVEFLRAHWDEAAYVRGASSTESQEDGWDPQQLTTVLADDFFWAHWCMQRQLRLAVQGFSRWAEGCSCHEFLLIGASTHEQEKGLRSEIEAPGNVALHCPCMSCRWPEMAAGRLELLTQELESTKLQDCLLATHTLTPEQMESVQVDWERGVLDSPIHHIHA